MRLFLGLLGLSLLSAQAVAQSSTTASTSSNTSQASVITGEAGATGGTFSGALIAGYSSNLIERESFENKAQMTAEALLNFRISGPNILRAYMVGTQEQTQGRESKLGDGYVGWVNDRFWHTSKILNVGQHVRLIAPLSRESRLRDERITGVTVAPIAVLNLTPVGLTGVSLFYQPAGTKNFHRYEQNRAFRSNNEYSLSQLFRALYSFTENAYLMSDFVYRNFWSYEGTRKNDLSSFSVELGYSLSSAFIIAAGMTTDSTISNFQNASDDAVEFFNQRTSTVYTEVTYAF